MLNFAKIADNSTFSCEQKGVRMDAVLTRQDYKKILCKLHLEGILKRDCDLCGIQEDCKIDERVDLILSDGVYEDEEHKLCDVYECFEGKIDLEEIMHSELELILNDYYYCKNCMRNR